MQSLGFLDDRSPVELGGPVVSETMVTMVLSGAAAEPEQRANTPSKRPDAFARCRPFWSLRFNDPEQEARFLQFNAPAEFTVLLVLLLLFVATVAGVADGEKPSFVYVGAISRVLNAVSLAVICVLLILDLMILVMARRGAIRQSCVAKIRQLESLIILVLSLVLTISQRAVVGRCWSPGVPQHCLRSLDPGQSSFFSLCFVASLDFTTLAPLLTCPIVAEFLIAYLVDPREISKTNRFSRMMYLWCVTNFAMVYLYRYESRSRERFVVADSLRVLREAAAKHHKKTVSALRSVCPADALDAFLHQRLVRNDADVCSILVLRASDFAFWRQQFTVDEAFNWMDVVHEAWEKRRRELDVERVSVRGDTCVFSSGLRRPSVDGTHNTEPILLFALRQLTYFARSGDTLTRPFVLRGAVATGPCSGVMLPGAPVAYVASGPGFKKAMADSRKASPGKLIVSQATIDALRGDRRDEILLSRYLTTGCDCLSDSVSLFTNPLGDATGFLATSLHASEDPRRGSESGLEWAAPEPVNEEMERVARLTAKAKEIEELQKRALSKSWQASLVNDLPGYAQFLLQQAQSQRHPVTAVWVMATLILCSILAYESSITPVAAALLVIAAGIGCSRALSLKTPILPWLLWVSGVVQVLLLMFAVRFSSGSILKESTLPLYFLASITVLEAAALGSVVPGLVGLALVQVALIVIDILCPGRTSAEKAYAVGYWILTTILATVWLFDRQVSYLCRFLEADSHATWLTLKSDETELHRRVLDCLLPEYIVSHVLQKQTCEWSAVADLIPDLGGLYVRMPQLSDMEAVLSVSQVLDSAAVVASGAAHVVFRDGDTCIVAGPLRRQVPIAGHAHLSHALPPKLAPVSTSATPVEEVVFELLVVLGTLKHVSPSAVCVVHRGDGAAVVFGSTLPTFSIEGPISEVGLGLLNMLEETESVITAAACQDLRRPPPAISIGDNEVGCRIKGAGHLRFRRVVEVWESLY